MHGFCLAGACVSLVHTVKITKFIYASVWETLLSLPFSSYNLFAPSSKKIPETWDNIWLSKLELSTLQSFVFCTPSNWRSVVVFEKISLWGPDWSQTLKYPSLAPKYYRCVSSWKHPIYFCMNTSILFLCWERYLTGIWWISCKQTKKQTFWDSKVCVIWILPNL